MNKTVLVDSKGRLVLPKTVRAQAVIDVNHGPVVKVTGLGRVELLPPSALMARAQEIGTRKLAEWKKIDNEEAAHIQASREEKMRLCQKVFG